MRRAALRCLSLVLLAAAGPLVAQPGVPKGAEFRVNTYTTGYQKSPSVASDASGNFVVVWNSDRQDGSNNGVFGQRYASSGAPAGAEFQVNTFTSNAQGFPRVASDAAGNFVVVWNSDTQDGSNDGVFAQRYTSSGGALGAESRVNSHTTVSQTNPSVASDSSGNFVVVWQSSNQDGSFTGVFGQRYGKIFEPVSLSLSQGRVQVTVDWRSQYSGQSGTAFAIPQQDGFGFFYFTDPGNPEVFVKVLDFGQGGALCFVGGLSDFFYKVTFKTVRTGQTLVFEKPAGAYVGFADNGTLRFGRPAAPGVSSRVTMADAAPVVAGILPFGELPARASVSPAAAAQSLTLSQNRVQVVVEWRSQYSGQSGTAFAIPQQDGFGFFYFTDPGNPEVFVKVLDFGQGGALCFVGGLSDFFYKVTFTTVRTGQTLVFEKPAGLYVGFADNGTLRF
jgi:hypothetical protein